MRFLAGRTSSFVLLCTNLHSVLPSNTFLICAARAERLRSFLHNSISFLSENDKKGGSASAALDQGYMKRLIREPKGGMF